MTDTEKYIVETVIDNLRDNIDYYMNNNEELFLELKYAAREIDEETDLSTAYNIYSEYILLMTLDIIKNLKKLPCLLDLRDGI